MDDNFTVNAVLPNAKAGDTMTVELLMQQVPAGAPAGSATQLLPIAGTQKKVILTTDLTATVNFKKSETLMTKAGDVVTVTFASKTESASRVISMKKGPLFRELSIIANQFLSFVLQVLPTLMLKFHHYWQPMQVLFW